MKAELMELLEGFSKTCIWKVEKLKNQIIC